MGLFGEFSHTCPTDIQFVTEWCNIADTIDYSTVTDEAFTEFENASRGDCPVRTGNLLSTISGSSDDNGFYAEVTADYAEYVEYGTWKMDAQPFFMEAFMAAAESCGEGVATHCQEVVSQTMEIAIMEIEEFYNAEAQKAEEEYEAAMAQEDDDAEEEYMARMEELSQTYSECVAQVQTDADAYIAECSFDITAE